MRRAISRKLRSQQGASLLLAVLFLLICSMVSASILMAAAANAGKHRSNLEEHQTYLALSSAVRALCDELNAAEYRGQYYYWEVFVPDEDDPTTGTTYRYFKQVKGQYGGACQKMLLGNFDEIFKKMVNEKLSGTGIINTTVSTEVGYDTVFTHTLTLTPQTGTALDGRPVTVTLEVEAEVKSYAIYLTAQLDDYLIRAELTPNENKPGWTSLTSSSEVQQTNPMQWRLGWITPGPEEEGGGS